MMERPERSSSLARAKIVSAPSPLITDMREASGRISDLPCRIIFWRRSDRDAQRVHEAWKELKDRGRSHQFQNLLIVVHGFQPGEESIVDLTGRVMQPVGATKSQFLCVGERSAFKISFDR